MAKRKHTSEWMLERIEEYLTGKGSYREIVLDVIRFCNASFFQYGRIIASVFSRIVLPPVSILRRQFPYPDRIHGPALYKHDIQ